MKAEWTDRHDRTIIITRNPHSVSTSQRDNLWLTVGSSDDSESCRGILLDPETAAEIASVLAHFAKTHAKKGGAR